jgi:hypothetical protein
VRLHWFTPWPPARHDAARRSRDIARALAARGHEVALVVADAADDGGEPLPPGVTVVGAAEYATRPADLAVYAAVASPAGSFIWPHLVGRPGLAILHDVNLYAARAARATARAAAFRSEFVFSEPDVNPDAAELAVAGFEGTWRSFWPMTRLVVETSRAVAAPTNADARDLQARWPGRPIVSLTAGIAKPPALDDAARLATRAELRLPAEAIVFAVCLTPDEQRGTRRLAQILRAFAGTVSRVPAARLLVAADQTFHTPPDCGDRLVRMPGLTGQSRPRAMAAVDVLIDLHWPRPGGPNDHWLAAMAAGRPALVIDSEALSDWPLLDPRSWQAPPGPPPVGVAIDVLDEDHSLRAALYRLAIDPALRLRLGIAAMAFCQKTHTLERMAADAMQAIDLALAAAPPAGELPPGVGMALGEN